MADRSQAGAGPEQGPAPAGAGGERRARQRDPLAGAQRMARAFPDGKLAVLHAVDHWLYRHCQSPFPQQAIDTYLRTLKTPPAGTVYQPSQPAPPQAERNR